VVEGHARKKTFIRRYKPLPEDNSGVGRDYAVNESGLLDRNV